LKTLIVSVPLCVSFILLGRYTERFWRSLWLDFLIEGLWTLCGLIAFFSLVYYLAYVIAEI
jgi:hypothetical protein